MWQKAEKKKIFFSFVLDGRHERLHIALMPITPREHGRAYECANGPINVCVYIIFYATLVERSTEKKKREK